MSAITVDRQDHAIVPTPPPARYQPPRVGVDPDPTKSWIRRMHPVVWSHRWLVGSGIAGALVTLLLQIAGPRVLMDAIDRVLVPMAKALAAGDAARLAALRDDLVPYVLILAALAVARFGIGYVFRNNIARTATAIEYDLRTIIYDHLS
ncbi:MAG TPA: hypothetical protein VMY34_04980, partial [Acidimicrobiales bacterium]|nr:hypothetical protein [Acidimicrobiales bacterium]